MASRHQVEAHQIYLKYHHEHERDGSSGSELDSEHDGHKKPVPVVPTFPMFHRVMKTGVIYATSRAATRGFTADDAAWANMGQGAPETGPIKGAPERNFTMTIPDAELEYAPVTGLLALREKVAHYYNLLYRQGKDSQYKAENICIVPGGRAGITRIMVRYLCCLLLVYHFFSSIQRSIVLKLYFTGCSLVSFHSDRLF
jgi:hypothetical protein